MDQKIHGRETTFLFSGENLLTITSYPGLDPEMGTSITYPLTRQFAFGAQLSFNSSITHITNK